MTDQKNLPATGARLSVAPPQELDRQDRPGPGRLAQWVEASSGYTKVAGSSPSWHMRETNQFLSL